MSAATLHGLEVVALLMAFVGGFGAIALLVLDMLRGKR